MGRATRRPLNYRVLSNHHCLLMILLQVNAPGVAVKPLKRDTPWSVDMDTEALRLPPQPMEVKSGHVELSQLLSMIDNIQPHEASGTQIRPNLGAFSFQEEILQPLVAEALDHNKV